MPGINQGFQFFDTLTKKPVLVPTIIITSTITIFILNIIGLQHGISVVFPHLFYLPIIVTAYYYPRYGVPFAVLLALSYCAAALTAGSLALLEMIAAVARSGVFVVIAAVVSYLSGRMHHDTQMCRRLVSVVKSSGDAIIGELPDGTITDWNASAEQLYGYTQEEMIGTSIFRLIPEEKHKEKRLLLERILKGESIDRVVTERITKDGRRIPIFLSSSPINNNLGDIIGISEIAHDITEQKRAEDALALANKKLNLLSSITRHDIRNQLMALNTYIELSQDHIADPAELKKFFSQEQKIADAINRQIGFTKDYEDLGVKAAVWKDPAVLVRDAGNALPLGKIVLDIRCTGFEIFADPLVEKVFYNLIDNSLHYGGERMTAICVSTGIAGGKLCVVYEDDGIGISAGDKMKLFTKGFGKHTGLGLFLSREILAITCITIMEKGEPDKGVRFEMTVPCGMWRRTGA